MTEYILIAVLFGGGFFFQSLFGFGGSFIVILGLSLFLPVQSVIAMLPVALMAGAGLVVLRDLKEVQWKTIFKVVLFSAPGVIFGAVILDDLNSGLLIIAICILILIYSLYSLFVKDLDLPGFIKIPYLILSGFIIGTTGLGIIYVPLVVQTIKKPSELRVSLNLLWALLGILRLPFYFQSGIMVKEHLILGMSVIPVLVISQYFGKKVHSSMNTESYHRGVLVFLGVIVVARLVYAVIKTV